MNFKMQDKQNQLIERISDTHLIVGVDIAQQLHVASAVNFRGIVVGDPLIFENNEEGFVNLLNWIQNLKRLKNLEISQREITNCSSNIGSYKKEEISNMPEPGIRLTKIWEDVDFYEVNMEFNSNYPLPL
jgi:hypothetical protein